jgi:tetratricopeptide (TPR) repeat protein
MKVSTMFRRDRFFYPLTFVVWAALIWLANAKYSYFSAPIPGVQMATHQSPAAVMKTMSDVLAGQRLLLLSEKNLMKRGQCMETMGTTFFQLYGYTKKTEYLDSAVLFYTSAGSENTTAPGSHYMLARALIEKKNFSGAQAQYEKAIALDPRSPLYRQALGILLWYNLKQSDRARPVFEKAAALDSTFPTVHYMLGEIALEKNDPGTALRYFEKETGLFLASSKIRSVPAAIDQGDIRMAACYSSLRLAFLYSTYVVDAQKAQDRFGLYMKLETDPQRKQASMNEIQKYWKTSQTAGGPR